MSNRLTKLIMMLGVATMLLVACGGEEAQPSSSNNGTGTEQMTDKIVWDKKQLVLQSEKIDGDFKLALFTDKLEYEASEPVNVYAELSYIGDEASIEIGHAAYPVGFYMYEHTREIAIPGFMNEPYVVTAMEVHQPHRYELSGIGGYSSEDPKNVVDLNKSIAKREFPAGQYTVYAKASFHIHGEDSEQQPAKYEIPLEISFEVK